MRGLGATVIFLGTTISFYYLLTGGGSDPQTDAPSGGLAVGIAILVIGIVVFKRSTR